MRHFVVFLSPVTLTLTFDCDTRSGLTAKFHRRTFNRSEIIVLANKQTDKLTSKQTQLKTSTSLRCATPVGKMSLCRYSIPM